MMCVGEEGGGVSVCQEQNGAPLVCSGSQVSGRVPLKLLKSYLSEYQLCSRHITSHVNQQEFQSAASKYNYLQVSGLSSWGYGCGEPLMPDIFTSLAYYRDWILDNITS